MHSKQSLLILVLFYLHVEINVRNARKEIHIVSIVTGLYCRFVILYLANFDHTYFCGSGVLLEPKASLIGCLLELGLQRVQRATV